MDPANRILELLYDADRPIWVAELAGRIAGDVPAVDGALARLAGRGHRLERGPEGVRLVRPVALDAHLIERDLPVARIGRHVICFGEVDSTSDVAFGSAAQAPGEALVVTAEFQRGGRGRLGRRWICPRGAGVLASVLLPGTAEDWAPDGLTLAAGVAVAEGVEAAAGVATDLAWPNDVVIDGAKLAGVLVEVRDGRVVVGVGINVVAAPAPDEIGRSAVCLAGAAGRAVERIDVLRAVLAALDARAADLADGRADAVHDAWVRRCRMINRRVRVASADGDVAGRVVDVSPAEGLVLLTDAGRRLHLPAATSTLLPG